MIMNDLLEFLNTADIETLKRLTSISSSLAARVVKERPFITLQDCSRIPKLSEAFLAKLQNEYEGLNSMDNSSNEEIKAQAPQEVTPAGEQGSVIVSPKNPGRVGRILTRIGVTLVILAALAALVYYGVPFIYEKFINPVETNAVRVNELANKQAQDLKNLEGEIVTLQERASTLEARAEGVDLALTAHAETLARLEAAQTTLNTLMETQKTELLNQMADQLRLTRAIELLSRCRLYLSQSNFGLAKDDLQASRDTLFPLLTSLPTQEANALKVVLSRMDLALNNLPTYPVVAVYDVDIAWKLLVDGLPNVPPMAVTPQIIATELTQEPSITELAPELSATLEVTPTP
jgi:hypothetical protein